MKATTILLITLLSGLQGLWADDVVKVKDHSYPLMVEEQQTHWNLSATEHFRYKRIFSVFTAALYRQQDDEGIKLRFTYTRSLDADDLKNKAMETLRNQHSKELLTAYQPLTEQIQAAYLDVSEGDVYTITVHPEKGTWLHHNEKELFYTENAEFGKWYLGIWLGENPANDNLKEALLSEEHS